MQLKHAFLLSIFSLFTLNSLACEQQIFSDELICSGTFKAKSLADIETYKTNPNHALKNLAIAFNLEADESLEVHTPCQVRFLSTNAVNTTGDLCIDARNGIYVQTGYNFRASDVNLFSKKRIVFAPEVNVNVRDLSLITFGDSIESRAHIRHNSNVSARNLTLQAQQRVTLGYESLFNITEKLILNSNLEFSGIWRDTTVNAANVEITSNNLITLAGNVQINSPNYSATSPECKIPTTSTNSLLGNCNDTTRPTVKLKSFQTSIQRNTTLTFDTSRSIAPNGIKEMILKVNAEVLTSNSYTFSSPGIYYVEAVLIDNNDFKSSIKRKVVVKEEYKKDLRAYFRYGVEDEVLTLTYMQNIAKEQVSNAKFKIYDRNDNFLSEYILNNPYHLDFVQIEDLVRGTYKASLEIVKTDGEIVIYEQDVFVGSNLEVSNALPLLDFDLYRSAPKEVFLDARRILDPYHNFLEIIVDWGDESSESFEADFLIGQKHTYAGVGVYEVKVIGIKENEKGRKIVHEVIKEITVANESVPSMAPIASFYYDVNDNFPHVTFNINLVRSPTSNIGNIKFDFGDGQVFEGTPENFPEIHTHFYDPGVYIATLTATDTEGLSTSLSSRIVMTESGPPLVTALSCEVLEGTSVTCETALVDKYKEITSASLNWGDGTSSDLEVINGEWLWDNFDHNFSSTGIYNIEVVVNTLRGQTATRNLNFEIKDQNTNPPPLFLNCSTNYLNLNCNAFTDFENASRLQRIDFYLNGEVVQSGTNSTFHFTASENRLINIYTIGDFGNSVNSTTQIQNISLRENEAPIADFECSSNEINKIVCFNRSTDEIGNLNSLWSIDGKSIDSYDLNYEFSDGGEKEIALTVTDEGGLHVQISKLVLIRSNVEPVANFDCSSSKIGQVHCTNRSQDADGHMLSSKWVLDGKEINLANLEYQFTDGGIKHIELFVTDPFGGLSSKALDVDVIKNIAPTIGEIFCDDSVPASLNCTVSASDSENQALSYIWFIDGVPQEGNHNFIKKEFASKLNVQLKVVVSDTYAAEAISIKDVVLKPLFVTSNFSCDQNENYKIRCDGKSSNVSKYEGIKYQWKVDGVEYSINDTIEVSRNEAGPIEISLEVSLYEGTVKDIFISQLEIREILDSELPSLAEITFETNVSNFINIEQDVVLKTSVKNIKYNLENEPEYLSIALNEAPLSDEEYIIEGEFITILKSFSEGENDLVVKFIDEDGRTFDQEFKFFAGSKVFIINFVNTNSEAAEVSLHLLDHKDREFKFSVPTSGYQIENVPNLDFIAIAKDGRMTRSGISLKDSSGILAFDMRDDQFVVNENNLDFSQGISGWTLTKGEFEISSAIPDVFGRIKSDELQLSLTPNQDGEIFLKSFVKAKDLDGKTHLSFPQIFNAKDLKSFYFVRATNLRSNETELKFYRMEDIGSTKFKNNFLNEVSINVIEDDIVEYEVYVKYFGEIENQTFYKKIFNKFISQAFANTSQNEIRQLEPSFRRNTINENIFLRDMTEIGARQQRKISTFVTGAFNPSFNNISPISGRRQINYLLKFTPHVNGIENSSLIFNLIACPDNVVSDSSECVSYPINLISGSEYLVNVEEGDSFNSFLKLYIQVSLNGNIVDVDPISNAESGLLFYPLVNLAGLGIVDGRPHEASGRFSGRETDDGGDEWVSPFHVESIRRILNASYVFRNLEGADLTRRVLLNDATLAGFVEGHLGHKRGTELDMRFINTDGVNITPNEVTPTPFLPYSDILRGRRRFEVHNIQDAKSIENVFNTDASGIEKILVTNKELIKISDNGEVEEIMTEAKLKDSSLSAFINYTYSSCLNDGNLMSQKLIQSPDHGDHFHVTLHEVDSDYQIKRTQKQVYSIDSSFNFFELISDFNSSEQPYYKFTLPENLKGKSVRFFLENTGYSSKGLMYHIPSVPTIHTPIYMSEDRIYTSNKYFTDLIDNPSNFEFDNMNPGASLKDKRRIDYLNFKIKLLIYDKDGCVNRTIENEVENPFSIYSIIPIPWGEFHSVSFSQYDIGNEYGAYKTFKLQATLDYFSGFRDGASQRKEDFNRIFLTAYTQLVEVNNFEKEVEVYGITPTFHNFSIDENFSVKPVLNIQNILNTRVGKNEYSQNTTLCTGASCCNSASIYQGSQCNRCASEGAEGNMCKEFSYEVKLTYKGIVEEDPQLCRYRYEVNRISHRNKVEFHSGGQAEVQVGSDIIVNYVKYYDNINEAGYEIFSQNLGPCQ